jgi:membrane-bound lytic murein transglycosylase B
MISPNRTSLIRQFATGDMFSVIMLELLGVRQLALASVVPVLLTLWLAPSAVAQQLLTGRPDVEVFLDELASRHQFDRKILAAQFVGLTTDPKVIRLMKPVAQGERSWVSYRANHLDQARIREGGRFLANHRSSLNAAERAFGVPAEIITAILGIETNYGRDKGTFQVLRSLTTLTFSYPERAEEFRPQLVDLLLLARDQAQLPEKYVGSFAGAMGYPQFMPTAWRNFGIDGDGDGKVDLVNSVDDAIFSIGNYLRRHGWSPGAPVALPVSIPNEKAIELRAARDSDKPSLGLKELLDARIRPLTGTLAEEKAILVDLPSHGQPTKYWVGYPNFYALMQYNRSFFYAMAVYQLSRSWPTK